MTDVNCLIDKGPVPRPPLKVGGHGTQGPESGTGTRDTCGTPEHKILANVVLLRLGKRDTGRDTSGTKSKNRCPAPPKSSEVGGTPRNDPKKPPSALAWDSHTVVLIDWFLKTPPPSGPFELYQSVTILNPTRWWKSVRTDIAIGPGKGRAYYGGLKADLLRLAKLFGGPEHGRLG